MGLARPSSALALLVLAALAEAQSNQDPAIDVRLSAIRVITALARQNGVNGIACETTVCNEGTAIVPWLQPMNTSHPTIAFLIAAERDGRLVQISNHSYLKHGFFAANAGGCGTCIQPGQNALGLGCSDTYDVSNNGDNFFLGPPEEVDPWLGNWSAQCSLFDHGEPPVAAPADCDSVRSLTRTQSNALGPIHSRVQVRDEDLDLSGPFYMQAQYNVRGMPDAARDDSLGSRRFTATFAGTRWTLTATGGLLSGTILQRWPDASIGSSTNGNDDGRVYVAVKVTGPVAGFYHYEYALHNRDNVRGIGALRIPVCSGARVRAIGFRDLDQDATNDWSARVAGGELQFAGAGAPLVWNTLTNFWFDSDAAPLDAALVLDEAAPGAGLPQFGVASRAPLALYNAYLGPGCAQGTPPTLYATGAPARATLGNATFALASENNAPFQPSVLLLGTQPGSHSVGGCTLWMGASTVRQRAVSVATSDAQGLATHAGPIPNDLALEGQDFRLQTFARDPGHGVLLGDYELSDGLLVRVGDSISDCP